MSQKFVENSQNVVAKSRKAGKVLVLAGRLNCHIQDCVRVMVIVSKRDVINTIQAKEYIKFGFFHNTFCCYLYFCTLQRNIS